MPSEDVIFDLVLTTSPDKFIPWFHHDWIMWSDGGLFTCASGEYTVELGYIEPDPAQEVYAHEITFIGKPSPSSRVNLINPDGSIKIITLDGATDDREELALGYMLIWELEIEKIQVKGVTLDYAEFDDYLLRFGEHISELYTPIKKYIQGEASDSQVIPNEGPDALSVGSTSTFPELNNKPAPKSSSKRGPVQEISPEAKLKALKEWENDWHSMILEEWLISKFGYNGGQPMVAVSTFHGWRKQLKDKGLWDS